MDGPGENVKTRDHHNAMIACNMRASPEMTFIDEQGRLRFPKFGYFDPVAATRFIKVLLDE